MRSCNSLPLNSSNFLAFWHATNVEFLSSSIFLVLSASEILDGISKSFSKSSEQEDELVVSSLLFCCSFTFFYIWLANWWYIH